MGEDDEMWARLASLEDIRDYRFFPAESRDSNVGDLDSWKSELEPVHILKTLLVMIDEKNGCTFAQSFDSEDKAVELADFLSENGLNVWLGKGMEDEDSIYAELFVSNEDYPEDFFDKHRERRDNKIKSYHREQGEFFGYPQKSVEAFAQGPSLTDRLWNVLAFNIDSLHIRRGDIIHTRQALEKYGQDLSEQETKDFRSLIFYVLEDSEESFQQAVETAEERRKAIEKTEEETGKDFLYLQDEYIELLDNFGQS